MELHLKFGETLIVSKLSAPLPHLVVIHDET
jgi:hypothetical protein